MNVFTVSFFGHRIVENITETEKKLTDIVNDIIKNNDYVRFLVGRDGEFDWLATSVISRVTAKCHNSYLVLVLPYMKAGYRDHKQNYMCCYNEVEICQESSEAYFKEAIHIRNKNMVDRSDLVVFHVKHKSKGAYKTLQYAQKQNHNIINI
ncbi:MAG: hypothetical protein NC177_02525 [Ruminococcus flavefaciens]|nr:hypothetical protein [Ruminococcus flavefaciens]